MKSAPKKVLVIAAHPDDEVLGCGGALIRHCQKGDCVRLIFLSDGVTSRLDATEAQKELRNQCVDNVCKHLDIEGYDIIGLPDNQMDSLPLLRIVHLLEPLIDKFKPQLIYTHHGGDLNIDHQLTFKAVMTAARPLPGSCVEKILCFETLSSTEWAFPGLTNAFTPNYFIDISECLDEKLQLMKYYAQEMRDFPHSRSYETLEHLARFRGSSAGLQAAEAFFLARAIEH